MWVSLLGGSLPLLIGLVIVLVVTRRSGKPEQPSPDMIAWYLQQRNQEWVAFIEAYDQLTTTPEEKQLLRHILYDAMTQGLGASAIANQYLGAEEQLPYEAPAGQAAAYAADYPTQSMPAYPPPAESHPIDNTSLLLYFGAFLFVASVSLFIAFGGATATVRALAVLLVMAVMYGGGQWLYHTKPRLKQAGLAFVAIGIVIAPLAGLAFYDYIFAREHGALIWLLTSAFCLLLYAHALLTLKKPLISYLLIFTFLSLFESGVSIVSAPVFYFGWGLALVGIILQLLARWRGYYPELKESSRYSSQVLLPISLLTSLALLPEQGSGQVGVSLLLVAAFYALEAVNTKAGEREANAMISQSAVIAATGCLVYAASHRWLLVVVGILAMNVLQALMMLLMDVRGKLWRNFASVLLTASFIDVMLAIGEPSSLLPVTVGLFGTALVVWWRQRRADAYGIGVLAFIALPYLYGQVTASPRLHPVAQVMLALAALLVLFVVYLLQLKRSRRVADWVVYAQVSYTISAISVVIAGWLAGPAVCLGIAVLIAATMTVLAEGDKGYDWGEAAGIFLLLPIVRAWSDQSVLLAALLVGLVSFIGLSLRHRSELLRWGTTLLWLLLPLGLGRGALGGSWTPAEYAWSYMAVMAALIISRSVARGVVLFSAKIPLASYARSASLSYVVGYIMAAALALGISLGSSRSALHTTLILLVLTAMTLLLSDKVEKRRDIEALVPLLLQAVLLSALRPPQQGGRLDMYLLASTALAALFYTAAAISNRQPPRQDYLRQMSLVTAFIAPVSILWYAHNCWPMPFGLLVAGGLLCHFVRQSQQAYRELAGAVITTSLLWFLGTAHVQYLQAYVHVIIANLALYAYWRARRNETEAADGYLWAMLATATVPLALQALSGVAGGLYGWWLLLEQVVFMLLGMTLRKRFVTFWGLYVAVAAVLFQLRHLGWAALTVLALFLIGLAIYQLQKHSEQS